MVRPLTDAKQDYADWGFEWDSWTTGWFHPTYFLLNKNSDPKSVAEQIQEYVTDKLVSIDPNTEIDPSLKMDLRPLKEIYFHGNTERERDYVIHGNFALVTGLSAIALLILREHEEGYQVCF